jgi:hypothetical protein
MWYRLKLTLNTGTTIEYDHTPVTGNSKLYTFTVIADSEFTGFYMIGAESGCQIIVLVGIRRPVVCSFSFNLAAFDG